MSKGWVSVHRSILDHPFWEAERFTKAQAWIDLILNANHRDRQVMIRGQMITVERGQQIRSQLTLSKLWKWDRRTVNGFLSTLNREGMISAKSTQQTTVITICNYNEFQNLEENDAQQSTQQDTQRLHNRLHTNNNGNNGNKKNNKDIKAKINFDSWPSLPPEQLLKDWMAMRKRVKASCSQSAINNIGKQLHLAVAAGFTVEQCIAEAETRGWKGFKAEWMKNHEKNRGNDQRSSAQRVSEKLDEIAARDIAQNGFADTLGN